METALTSWNIIFIIIALTLLLVSAQVHSIKRLGIIYRKKWSGNYSEAKAMILSVSPTGKYLNLKLQVKIQLQVLPATGRNFVVEFKTLLSTNDLSELQTGRNITVRYNPLNVKEISFVKGSVK